MPSPTRLYLRTNQAEYRPLAWFQNNKPNEMLVGVYGLSRKQPVLQALWPEREVHSDELAAMSFRYDDAKEIGKAVDHITCHADGRFHIKTIDECELYLQAMQRTEPLGPDTNIFLEPILFSDLVQHYPVSNKRPKCPHVWFDVPANHCIEFRAMFSGVNYAVEKDMVATMAQSGRVVAGTRLMSGSIKGVLAHLLHPLETV